MRLISFNPYRSLGIPGVGYLKPERMFFDREIIAQADWILFPEYWQVNSLSYALKKRIFPSLSSYHLGHSKIEMTRALQSLVPKHVPHTLILPNTDSAKARVLDEFSFPFVLKEPISCRGQGVYLIQTVNEFELHASQQECLYVQEYLPIDADLRVVYVGDQVVTAYWRRNPGGFYNNISKGAQADFDLIPPAALDLVDLVCKGLNVNHAGFDLAFCYDQFYIFEFNVFFGNEALNQRGVKLGPVIFDYLMHVDKWKQPSEFLIGG